VKKLTQLIRDARSVRVVSELLSEYSAHMDTIHLATCIYTCGQLACKPAEQEEAVRLMPRLMDKVAPVLPQFTNQGL
jgi:hypothetical protein